MTDTPDSGGAILMAMMGAPGGDEREFHRWYDSEHLPERARIGGFRQAQRYVCLEGWPRYMALYDLDGLDVLEGGPYRAVAGANLSPWSKRIAGEASGFVRVEARQVYPGNVSTGDKGPPLRLAVLRIADVPAAEEPAVVAAFGQFLADIPGVLQFRLFRSNPQTGGALHALIEFSTPRLLSDLDWSRLRLPCGHMDLSNMYCRYWRHE